MAELAMFGCLMMLLACGGAGDDAASSSAAVAAPEVSSGADTAIASCLELVDSERFAEAVPACQQAVNRAPESEQARAALASARQGAAQIDVGAEARQQAADALTGDPTD